LPDRDRHRILAVLSFTEPDGGRCFDVSPPVKDIDDIEAETPHQT